MQALGQLRSCSSTSRASAAARPQQRPLRSCAAQRRLQTVAASAQKGPYPLPKAQTDTVAQILAGQAQAEAAQQELMSNGQLAEAAADNPLLMNILQTYSTVQQLYHKALKPYLEQHWQYAGSAAGLSYALCCHLLQQPPSRVPGDSISDYALKDLVDIMKNTRPNSPIASLASDLHRFCQLELSGNWHTLPDLMTCLCTDQFKSESDQSSKEDSLLSSLAKSAGRAVLGSLQQMGEPALKADIAQLLISACSRPEDAITKEQVPDFSFAGQLLFIATGVRNCIYGSLISHALALLPASEQSAVIQAELELSSWRVYVHAYPGMPEGRFGGLERLVTDLRLFVHAAAFSHMAYLTTIEHLAGREPMHDWEPVLGMLKIFELEPSFAGTGQWLEAQQLLARLDECTAELSSGKAPDAGDDDLLQDFVMGLTKLEEVGSPTMHGLLQSVGSAHVVYLTSSRHTRRFPLDLPAYQELCAVVMNTYARLDLKGATEVLNYSADGFSSMMYWLEIQDMALRLAGGTPGPEAEAAANWLIQRLPHTFVIARPALRCANALVTQSIISILPSAAPPTGQRLRSVILAKGSPQLAAQIDTLGKLSAADELQALTPFAAADLADNGGPSSSSSSSKAGAKQRRNTSKATMAETAPVLSVGDSVQLLLQQLTQPQCKLTQSSIVQLLCGASSPEQPGRRYQPALSTSLAGELLAAGTSRVNPVRSSLWLGAALLHRQLYEAAAGDSDLATMLMGPARSEEVYIRSIAEFLAGKQQTADAFAEAVCEAGWRLDPTAARALVLSLVLSLCKSPDASLRAYMWASASMLAQPSPRWGRGASDKTDEMVPGGVVNNDVPIKAFMGQISDEVAARMPLGYDWVDYITKHCDITSSNTMDATQLCAAVRQVLAESGGSFYGLEPAMQALLQAAAERALCSGADVASPTIVSIIQAVPLLNGSSYTRVLDRVLIGTPSSRKAAAFAEIWSAAVSAATDSQLAAMPAFGMQRPNMPWLLNTIPLVWHEFTNSKSTQETAPAFFTPLCSAVEGMLSQQGGSTGGGDNAASDAAQLLDGVCTLLAKGAGANQTVAQQAALQQVLQLLLQHPELPPIQHLPAALSAAIGAEVAAGGDSSWEAAEQLAAAGRLSADDICQLGWAMVEAAATVAASNMTPDSPELLLRYWSTAVLSPGATAPSNSTATAVVKVMVADTAVGGNVCQQLLAQPLPTGVLAALMQACSTVEGASSVLPLLLAHALQHGKLQELPAAILPQLLQTVLAAADVPFGDCMQLLGVVLQQQDRAAGVSTAMAKVLTQKVSASTDNMQQFAAVAQQHTGSPAVSVLLCAMLQAASTGVDTELSWKLFELLQECSTLSAQQLAACSAVLAQQTAVTSRVLAVWRYCCTATGSKAAAIQQLAPAAQQAVVAALMADQQTEEAFSVVQQAPALLPHLANIWQKQDQAPPAALLQQALQLCVTAGSANAAAAAETLTGLLLQQGAAATDALKEQGELAAQLVQLLCAHGMTATALQLLPACLAGTESGEAAAGAIAAAATVVTQQGSIEQQAQFLQLMAGSNNADNLQGALSHALVQGDPAAVGLLLHALQDSAPGQHLGQMLAPAQLEQLCKLVCNTADNGSRSSTQSSLTNLPGVLEFAQQCLAAKQLPGAVAAQLLNALCKQHSELQPSSAVVHFESDIAAVDAQHGSAAPATVRDPAAFKQLVQTIAALCYSQITESSSAQQGYVALEAAFAEWAPTLSPEAAAAALFAAWVHRGDRQLGAAVPLLCLELYQRGKLTGDSLVFDLGLAAAAEAAEHTGNWHRGEGIIAAAQKAHAQQHAAEGRKGSTHAQWVPSSPAACCALLLVLVHTEGVQAAAKVLMREHEQQQGLLAANSKPGPAAAGRKGRAASGSSISREQSAATPGGLLTVSVVNAFMSAAVSVARACQAEGSDDDAESAAQSALQVAQELFPQQLLAVTMVATGAGVLPAATANGLSPDAITWGCLAQLNGVLGQWQQVSSIVLAAVKQKLPGAGTDADGLQVVLAGVAAAFNAAGRYVTAVQLLDGLVVAGVSSVSHPQLAHQLLKAADSSDAEKELIKRLHAGEDGLYALIDLEAAMAVGSADTAAVPAVQLVKMDTVQARKQLTANLPH